MAKTFSRRTKTRTVFNALVFGMEVPIGRYIYILRNCLLLRKEKQSEKFHPVLTVALEELLDLFSSISNVNMSLLRKKYKTHDFKKLSENKIFDYNDG